MALYVAICLLAALIALPETEARHLPVVGIIWGVSAGLALAHWFAFRVSARLVGAGRVRGHDLESAAAQLLGAGAVAGLATLAVILMPAEQPGRPLTKRDSLSCRGPRWPQQSPEPSSPCRRGGSR